MSLKTKQHVRSPRAGIRCSAVHSPDRYIRDLDRRLSARGQTVNCFERKEFSYAAVATYSSRRTFRGHRTQHGFRTSSWPGGCSHLDGSGPDESVGLFVRPWHVRHPAGLPILGRGGGGWPSRQDRVEGWWWPTGQERLDSSHLRPGHLGRRGGPRRKET